MNSRWENFKLALVIDGWDISFEIALRWISLELNIGSVRQQAITWANVDPDLCHHMASLGYYELNMLFGPYVYIQWALMVGFQNIQGLALIDTCVSKISQNYFV